MGWHHRRTYEWRQHRCLIAVYRRIVLQVEMFSTIYLLNVTSKLTFCFTPLVFFLQTDILLHKSKSIQLVHMSWLSWVRGSKQTCRIAIDMEDMAYRRMRSKILPLKSSIDFRKGWSHCWLSISRQDQTKMFKFQFRFREYSGYKAWIQIQHPKNLTSIANSWFLRWWGKIPQVFRNHYVLPSIDHLSPEMSTASDCHSARDRPVHAFHPATSNQPNCVKLDEVVVAMAITLRNLCKIFLPKEEA